jgi:hypothetical protein
LTGLKPGCRYWYRCGDGDIWSGEHFFDTFPDTPSVFTRFLVWGDMGTVIPKACLQLHHQVHVQIADIFAQGYAVAAMAAADRDANGADFALIVGDLAYAGVSSADRELEACRH